MPWLNWLEKLLCSTSSPRTRQCVCKTGFVMILLIAFPSLHAETISGVVRDQTGAVIANAKVEVTGEELAQPVVISSDGAGRFLSQDLKPGKYSLQVTQDGFEPFVKTIDLDGKAVQLEVTLAIAEERTAVNVPAARMEFANSDPVYRQLRNIGFGQTFRFDNYTIRFDVGTFSFRKGTLTILNPVDGIVTGGIFVGEGHFNLTPVTMLDAEELKRRVGSVEENEDFTEVVFRFSDGPHLNFLGGLGAKVETPGEAIAAFDRWKDLMRKRREEPLGFTEQLLHGERMDNVDADILAALYDRKHPQFINAYMRGTKHKDLRFFVRVRVGAIPQLDSPEEVALINYQPGGMDDGIWYLSHLKSEFVKHTASSLEDRRLFATHRYKIETIISKNQHLFSAATVTFQPLLSGERVLKFGLLPNLRVTRVVDGNGQDLYFIQENRKEDGSFYVILPEAPDVDKEYSITVQYAGDKVVDQAGGGSFYVRARTSWYPNLNGFGEQALYDLTFKVPRKYKVISIGKLESESLEGDFAVTHWTTPSPVAVAGFNYGDYKNLDLPDQITGYKITGYYLSELPDSLHNVAALRSLAPSKMTRYALEQTRAQLQLCTQYFGKSPYDHIYITEQPDFNFGQSWPNLVYLPISAYTDSTQRYLLFGTIDSKFTGFVQEVTPHEVSHQWWGHAVRWASYHDQWLSEGFADFSAGLFLQQAVGPGWQKDYIEYWDRLRKQILERNEYGIAPNDAGPLWLGLRLDSPRTADAYQNVTYAKGAYVLEMLRSMMYSPEDSDHAFIDMMHDFVESHRDIPASTETFEAIAEKHMTPTMDLQGNHRLDWFFNEWVYGTEVPRYKFDYQLVPSERGKVNLHMTVTQSEVDERFAMLIPVFADFGKGMVRLGQLRMIGSSTQSFDLPLPTRPKKVALNAFDDVLER
jgi:Peptidase family M1 domain/Carboxypeptidase regulatory-like domain